MTCYACGVIKCTVWFAQRFVLLLSFVGLFWLLQVVHTAVSPPNLLAAAPAAALDLSLELYATGLSLPTSIAHTGIPGDGRLFITQQGGKIRIIDAQGTHLPTSFLDITSKVSLYGENGLLGLAFDPNYAQNGYFYIYYTQKNDRNNYLARYRVNPTNPNQALANSETILMVIQQPKDGHNGGSLAFGPDNYLYIGVGDGGLEPRDNPTTKPQDLSSLLGKILRIDVSKTAVNQPDCGSAHYTIPADNPFADGPSGSCDEVWAYGLRNPWHLSFDRTNGDLFIGEVGENDWEEINWQPAHSSGGENYGWPCYEGHAPYNTSICNANPIQHTTPIFAYPHGTVEQHCAVSGGYVYRGTQYPFMQGHFLLADFCSGFVWILNQQGSSWQSASYGDRTNFPTTFGENGLGELFVAELTSGRLYHIVENTKEVKIPHLTISLTGPAENNAIDPILYELTVTNDGNAAATNLVVTNTVPAGAAFLTGHDGGILLPDNVVQWQIPVLEAQSSVTVSYEVTAVQTITNDDYRVTADEGYGAEGETAVITTIRAPQLHIHKTAPQYLEPGDTITYTITVENNGTLTATNVTITDTIPLHTTFLNANYSGQLYQNVVTWVMPPLPPQSSLEVQLAVMPDEIFTEPTAVLNTQYGVTAAGGYMAFGKPVVLIFNGKNTYLPLIQR